MIYLIERKLYLFKTLTITVPISIEINTNNCTGPYFSILASNMAWK